MRKLFVTSKILIVVINTFLYCNYIFSQKGYSDTLLLSNSYSLDVDDIIFENDQIYIHGNTYDSITGKWCLYMAILDTFGVIVKSNVYCDTVDYSQLISNSPSRFILLNKPHKIVIPTYYFEDNELGIFILDSAGTVIINRKYPNSEFTIIPKEIIYDTKYLYLLGTIQRKNYFGDCFIMKIDTFGNQIWLKYFGSYTFDNDIGDAVLNLDGTISVSSREFLFDLFIQNDPNKWIRPWIFTVDSSGNIINQWKGEKNDDRTRGFGPFYHLINGDWIICSFEIKDVTIDGNVYANTAPTISRLNSDYELIWKRYLGNYTGFWDSFVDLEYDSIRDEFVAAGHRVYYYSDVYQELEPWIVKFTPDGDILWSVSDTVFSDSLNGVMHFTSGMEISPSGSIYVAGYVEHTISPPKIYGWIMKVSPDGCMDTLCISTPVEEASPFQNEIAVHPNPAKDFIEISTDSPLRSFEIFSLSGGSVYKTEHVQSRHLKLNTSSFENGMYFIHGTLHNGSAFVNKFIILR